MVRKIFGFLYRETSSLNQAALLLGFFAFLSQILAFLRDRLLAHIFGAGPELDIYYAAFRIPDFLFVTVASMVSISVLIPFIIEKEPLGKEAVRELMDAVFTFFGILMLLAGALAYILMPALAETLFRGMAAGELEQVIFLSRLLLFSPLFLGLSNLFGSITQSRNRFTLYASAPLLYNAGIILGTILLAERIGVLGIVVGVVVGAALHLFVQVPFVWRAGLLPRLKIGADLALVRKVVMTSLPRTLSLSLSSLVLIFLVALAARMEEGSVSILSFSINLQSVPLSLIGISYSLAAFPILTRKFQEKDLTAFVEQMENSARFIIFWSLPLTALLIVLRAQVVRTLLGSGLFDWPATRLTAAALALFVLSAVFQSLLLLFMRGFYSAGRTLKPLLINLASTGILLVLTYALVELFYQSATFHYFVSALLKVEDLPESAVLMLPLGFSIGTILNALLLWAAFEQEFRGFSRRVLRTLFEGVGTSFIMGATAYAGLNFFDRMLDINTLVGIFLQGSLSGLIAIAVGVVILTALQSRELSDVWKVLRGRFWKAKVIATDPEIV